MRGTVIVGSSFRGGRWEECTAAMTTFEETLSVVKNHFFRGRFRSGMDTSSGIDFVVYRAPDGSGLVEVYRASGDSRDIVGFYKISAPIPLDNEDSWVA